MAWSVLQSKSAASAALTVAVTPGTALSSGSKLIAYVGFASGAAVSGVSDGTNSFSQIAAIAAVRQHFYIYVLDTPSGDVGTTPAITATTTGTANGIALLVQEVSGLAAGSTAGACLDGTAGTADVNGGSPGAVTVPAYSSTAASEFLVAAWSDNGDSTGVPMGATPSGFTADGSNIGGNGNDDLSVVYKNSTGAAEGGGTWNPGGTHNFDYADLIVAFKLGAGAVTGTANLAAAGSVTAVVTQLAPAAGAGAGAASAVTSQLGGASAAAAAAVTAAATQIAPATAAGAGAVTAAGSVSGPGTAAAAGAGAVTAVVTQIAPAAASGAGAVTATSAQAAGATAAGGGSAGPAPVTQIAPAASAGAGAVTDVATQIAIAAAAGAGSVTATGSVTGAGSTASAAAAAAVTAAATQIAPATAAGAGAVTDVATQIAKATAAAAGAVTAAGAITGTASAAGASGATAKAGQSAAATAAGAGILAVLAAQAATAALAGAGAVTAAGNIQLAFTVGTLTASDAPLATLGASAATTGAAALTASDTRTGGPGG